MIDKKSYYDRQKIILNTIKDIENYTTISKAAQSYKIMKLLRNECIYVSKEYLVSANHKATATLDPNDEGIKNILSRNNLVTDWYPIFANSFGPFNPKAYFESSIKILWLLKEPFITKESWVKSDRGGHNQALENRLWDNIVNEDNKTLINLINRTKTILNALNGNQTGNRISEQDTMNHICILEVNHFPGLNFKKADSGKEIGQWAKLNKELLKKLIGFYAPSIIIGGNTIGHFYSNVKNRYINTLQNTVKNGKYLLENIGIKVCEIKKPENSSSYVASGYYTELKGKVYVIDAYHPCPKKNKDYEYTDEIATADAQYIATLCNKIQTYS